MKKDPIPPVAVLVALLSLVAGPPVAAQGSAPGVEESWYRVDLAGTPAGWTMARETVADGRLVTETRTLLAFRRGAAMIEIETASRFVESVDGRALSAWSRQVLGAVPVEVDYELGGDAVHVRRRQGESVREEDRPRPAGEWLTPGQERRRLRELVAAGAEDFELRTLDPELGLEPITTRWRREAASEEVATDRGPVLAHRYRLVQSIAPGVETLSYLDAAGRLVASRASLLGLEMSMTLSERETALATSTSAPPEILVRSFVRPDRPIPEPRRLRRATYEVAVAEGELPELPSTGHQRVETAAGRTRIVVDLDAPPAPEASGGEDRYLRATTYLPHDDPRIRALLATAREGIDAVAPGPLAEGLRAFVRSYLVEKNLDTVLATATEVASTRAGDCTEHSVLLAALLRAAGIPARVVAGLVYVERFAGEDEIFAYHMWSQAWIDGSWIDLDSTLGSAPFDAAHIAFATLPLDDEQEAWIDIARIAPLMGRIAIRVLASSGEPQPGR